MAKRDLKATNSIEQEESQETTSELITGVVSVQSGFSLNLRKEPNVDSEVLTTIPNDTKILVEEQFESFYKVTTEAGLEGFVMKEFIKI